MYARVRSEALGRLEASPLVFRADSNQSFTLTYVAGATPIEPGGQIRLLTPRVFSAPNTIRARSGGPGWAAGFTEIVERPPGVELALTIEPPVSGHWVTTDVVLAVAAGRLAPGERIVVRYGGARSKVHVAKLAGRVCAFRALVDPDGSGQGPHSGYTFVANDVLLETLPGEPVRLEAYLPSSRAGAPSGPTAVPAPLLVVSKDAAHNVVSSRAIAADGPACRALDPDDAPVRRIEVRDPVSGALAITNPQRAALPREPRLYWGDLHVHTRVSDDASSERGPEDAIDFARDAMGHDSISVTDHVNNVRADEWRRTIEAARRALRPGRFVALGGFEFNSREPSGGRRLDRNVYYANLADATLPPGVSRDDYRHMTTDELAEWIDPARHLLVPHQHNGGLWHGAAVQKMRLVEIYAHWGAFDRGDSDRPFATGPYPPGALVGEALEAGLRLGFVGGSDTHAAHPGNDYLWPHGNVPGGLTAVWADDLTPPALFGALSRRACYATTRARIWLRVTVNGAPMGAELPPISGASDQSGEPRHIHVEAHGTAPFAEVSVIRSGQALRTWQPNDWDVDAHFADESPLSARGWDYYYVRLRQRDGELAWSSPIWIG